MFGTIRNCRSHTRRVERASQPSYSTPMLAALRRVIALLILTAYMSGTTGQHVLFARAMSGDMGTGMAHHQEEPSNKMPCKGTVSPCVTDLGCVFLVGLPAMPEPTLLTLSAWSSISYPGSPDVLQGQSVKPAIGPPISRA